MFSRPVSSGWKPVPTSSSEATRPRSRAVPPVGSTIRLRIFSSVDLPAPLRPTMPTTSPRPTSNETSLSAQNRGPPWACSRRVPLRASRAARSLPEMASRSEGGAPDESLAPVHAQVVMLAQSIADDDGSAHDGRSKPRILGGLPAVPPHRPDRPPFRRSRRNAARSCGSRRARTRTSTRADAVEIASVRRSQGRPEDRRAVRGDDPEHRVERQEQLPSRADQLGGIDHRRDIHQDLHQERDDVLEVAIEDRQRRQRHADAQRGDERQRDQEQQPDDPPARRHAVIEHHHRVDAQRDQQVDQEDRGGRDRHEEPREIDLGQQLLLVDQAQGRLRHALREQRPGDQPGEDEHRVGEAVGVDPGEPPEDHREDQHHDQGLEDRPRRPQHRLLVPHRDVAPDQEGEQLAVRPHLLPVDGDPSRARADEGLRGVVVFLGARGRRHRINRPLQRR